MGPINKGKENFSDLSKEDWIEEIMTEYGDRLTKLSFSYLKDWGRAQEVVQDVFITCYTMYDTFSEINSFKSWVYRVTINRSKDVLRSSYVKRVIVNSSIFKFITATGISTENNSIKKEEQGLLSICVLSLPIKYREVVLFFYYEDLSIQEISHLLKINQNTIKTRLRRGREMLKNLLESSDINER